MDPGQEWDDDPGARVRDSRPPTGGPVWTPPEGFAQRNALVPFERALPAGLAYQFRRVRNVAVSALYPVVRSQARHLPAWRSSQYLAILTSGLAHLTG